MMKTGNLKVVRQLDAAEKRAEALRLRAQGHSLDDIAKAVGYKHRGSVSKAINQALKEIDRPAATEYATLQVKRLETVLQRLFERLESGETAAAGHIVKVTAQLDRYYGFTRDTDFRPPPKPGSMAAILAMNQDADAELSDFLANLDE